MQKRSGNEEFSSEESELLKFMDGSANPRDKWGLRFAPYPEGGKSEHYKGSKSEKLAFKLQWAKTQLDKYERTRTRSTSYKNIDAKMGIYKTVQYDMEGAGRARRSKSSSSRAQHRRALHRHGRELDTI